MATTQKQTGCPECNGSLAQEGNETICSKCGLVVSEDRIDRGPEWRSFEDDEVNRERTGAPLTRSRHDRGLSTEIGSDRNVRMTGRKRRQFARMRREHNRAQISSKAERNQVYGFTEIRRIISTLDLPRDIRESACTLFDSAQSEDLLRGRSLEGFAAACVYASCRVRSISRTIDEIVEHARASQNELEAAYSALNSELGLPVGPIAPQEYIPRFMSELSVSDAIEAKALQLAKEAEEEQISIGRDPTGVAAGCIYTAAKKEGHTITQEEVADVADVSPVTLRKTYYDLK